MMHCTGEVVNECGWRKEFRGLGYRRWPSIFWPSACTRHRFWLFIFCLAVAWSCGFCVILVCILYSKFLLYLPRMILTTSNGRNHGCNLGDFEILPPMRQPSTPLEDWHDATRSPLCRCHAGTRDHQSWLPIAKPASQFSRRKNCNDADVLLTTCQAR